LKIFLNKYLEVILSFIILIPTSLSFILNPLTNDVRIFQGVARLSDYFGSFPSNLNLSWEIKPIGNRFINYLLYKVANLFTIFGSYEYEILIKIFGLIFVLIICYYFSTKFDIKYLFLLCCITFLTPLNFINMQSEWWASLFTLLVIGLFLSNNKYNYLIAGIGITFIFLLKGITIFLVCPIICIIYLLKPNWFERLKIGFIGSVLSLWFILIWDIFKDVIPDMLLSSKLAPIGYINLFDMITHLIFFTSTTYVYMPILAAGILSAFLLFYNKMKDRDINTVIVLIIMWVSTLIMILIQSEYFVYQFFVLSIPSILTIILVYNKVNLKMCIILILLIFIAFSSHWSYGMEVENKFWDIKNSESVNILNNITDITQQQYILYLDPGDAPYYFKSNSSCRFISPLPFQRNEGNNWNLSMMKEYNETYNCIINYNNKYIITDTGTWMIQNTTDNKKVWDKINNEYKLIWEKGWNIYELRV
jgi:hypothetical protein